MDLLIDQTTAAFVVEFMMLWKWRHQLHRDYCLLLLRTGFEPADISRVTKTPGLHTAASRQRSASTTMPASSLCSCNVTAEVRPTGAVPTASGGLINNA